MQELVRNKEGGVFHLEGDLMEEEVASGPEGLECWMSWRCEGEEPGQKSEWVKPLDFPL